MHIYVGIDGGGTQTRCVLSNEHLDIFAGTEGSASNPLVIGFENSADDEPRR